MDQEELTPVEKEAQAIDDGSGEAQASSGEPAAVGDWPPHQPILTLHSSPWSLIKTMPLLQKVKFFRAIVRTMLNPKRTEGIFEALDLVITRDGAIHEEFEKFTMMAINHHPVTRQAAAEGYLEPLPDLQYLAGLPDGTFGREYLRHLQTNGLDPVFYPSLDVSSPHRWIQMRGRQLHDHWHVLTGFGTTVPDELGLQAFSLGMVGTPVSSMIVGGGLMFCSLKEPWLVPDCMFAIRRGFNLGQRSRGPLMGLRYSEHWETPLPELRRILGIPDPALAPEMSDKTEKSAS